ncbi:Hef nuclease [archaeon SCG-AAA382B04]|nr:Hef nuclease [archaeon SCG-AAA382B04]
MRISNSFIELSLIIKKKNELFLKKGKMTEYVSHPNIKDEKIEKRVYQIELAGKALNNNSLVVLPTGLGKTAVSLLVIASKIDQGKCLVLSPTKPLVEQHCAFFRDCLDIKNKKINVLTGETTPEEREKIWNSSKLIIATPQVIKNDSLSNKISLKNVSHLTFDEAHRGVGDYSYVFIAEQYVKKSENHNILGITASPGSEKSKIKNICENLFLKNVEVRTEKDPTVEPYVHEKNIEWEKVKLPKEIKEAKKHLEDLLKEKMKELKKLGYSKSASKNTSKSKLLKIQSKLQGALNDEGPNPSGKIYSGLSYQAEAFKLRHLIDLLETEGIESAKKYIKKIESESNSSGGSKAAKRLSNELKFKKSKHKIKKFEGRHPKIDKCKKVVSKQLEKKPDSRIIVFTEYRQMAEQLKNILNKELEKAKAVRFVGQANKKNDKGLTQKKQVEIISDFAKGDYNVLVGTSVAEEGLDIPSTDSVVFYEPVPSEIRSIQRKGRTGRVREGKVTVLMTKNTKDEGFFWASKKREDKMEDAMEDLKEELDELEIKQRKIGDFSSSKQDKDKMKIFADHRELNSGVIEELNKLDLEVEIKQLEVGDFVLSSSVCAERKTTEDFISSMIDRGKRGLFDQLNELNKNFASPILLLEGEGLYTSRQVHPNAIRGAISTVSIDYRIPIINTKDAEETAQYLFSIAKKEQEEKEKSIRFHAKKSSRTLKEKQEYIVSALPMIGPKTAKTLLNNFGTIREIVNAEKRDLLKIEGIGEKRAKRIIEILTEKYHNNNSKN